MSHFSGNRDDFGMDTVSLTGPLAAQLAVVEDAGFVQIMLSATDLTGYAGGVDAAVALVRASGLRVTALRALRDYEGLSGPAHDFKIDVAKSLLDMCQALACRRLVVCSSTQGTASTETSALARDLRRLALMAVPMNVQIVYTATACGHAVHDYLQAWDLVCEADMPNLGLGLGTDVLDGLMSGGELDDLDMLDPDKIFLVQLADRLWNLAAGSADPADGGRGFQVFPGEGLHSETISALVRKLHGLGYRGDYSLDVANADFHQMPIDTVARHAKRSALWLGESVLQRSVPLPNLIRLKRH